MRTKLGLPADCSIGLKVLNDGQAVIKSLALNFVMNRPCVHRTRFNPGDNDRVIRAVQKWTSVVEN